MSSAPFHATASEIKKSAETGIYGYRIEARPGAFMFMTPTAFEGSPRVTKAGRVWELRDKPFTSDEVIVYRGKAWMQPKFTSPELIEALKPMPLYLGRLIIENSYEAPPQPDPLARLYADE